MPTIFNDMLSKNKIKYIRSLEQKKHRKEENAFLAEGPKLAGDLLGHFKCKLIAGTAEWFEANPDIRAQETIEVTREELAKASLLKTPQDVLAVFEMPDNGAVRGMIQTVRHLVKVEEV